VRVALLSYRSKPHCGGQGIYLRHISRELTALGHEVEVFSGQPYPELDEGVRLTRVPSLDLYREPDPFRVPHVREFRDRIDVLEFATMCSAGFPEPLTFSLRVARLMRDRVHDFDVIHDNQTLGTGLLDLKKLGLPIISTIHHPITVDRKLDLAAAPLRKRFTTRRWYGFLRMQKRVAKQMDYVLTVSENSAIDIARDFGVAKDRITVIPVGVDVDAFHPPTAPRVPGRLIAVASVDVPMKGVHVLLEAVAKLRTERDVQLTVVSRPKPGGPTEKLVDQLALGDGVRFVSGLMQAELCDLMGSAEVAVVPSLYEGFSIPAIEAMACATPLVASAAGALPEVVDDAGVLVPPGDASALAVAIARLLDDPAERERLGAAARRRVDERYTWQAVARQTAAYYEKVVAARRDALFL
jgi:glycosyltransferase involved in cell wall biosynthesis